jgi:hypothetical protein
MLKKNLKMNQVKMRSLNKNNLTIRINRKKSSNQIINLITIKDLIKISTSNKDTRKTSTTKEISNKVDLIKISKIKETLIKEDSTKTINTRNLSTKETLTRISREIKTSKNNNKFIMNHSILLD